MNYKPMAYYYIVRPIKQQTVTKSGIVLVEHKEHSHNIRDVWPTKGEIVAVPDYRDEDLEVGDIVTFETPAAKVLQGHKPLHYIIDEINIDCKIENFGEYEYFDRP